MADERTTAVAAAVGCAARPAMIPPNIPKPADACRICRRHIGVFAWTDSEGRAHPWCIESEKEKWNGR